MVGWQRQNQRTKTGKRRWERYELKRLSYYYKNPHLLLWTVYEPPAVVLDLLQLVKLHGDIVDGELQQVPEASQVLGGGPGHGTGVLGHI